MNDLKPGEDNKRKSWSAELNYFLTVQNEEGDPVEKQGTFRSFKCIRAGNADCMPNNICIECRKIPQLSSFRNRLLKRAEKVDDKGKRDVKCIRNTHLNAEEMRGKIEMLKNTLEEKDSKLFLLNRENLRLKLRRRTLQEKLNEHAKRGSIRGICHQLEKAAEHGALDDQGVLMDMLEATARNFHPKGKTGKRYKASLKQFLEVILYWGGPRLATFVSINLLGPEIHSVYCWRNQAKIDPVYGLSETNFQNLRKIYEQAMKNVGCGNVVVMATEDETAIIKKVEYHQNDDALLGFCGLEGDEHQCLDNFVVTPIGDGVEGYEKIVNAFQEYKIGCYARVIIINPLHPLLPKLSMLVMPTCNSFDLRFVQHQHDIIQHNYDQYLEPVLGPLIGNASDGDSRRRKLFVMLESSREGVRFQPIPIELVFVLTAEKSFKDNSYVLCHLCDDDYLHCHKKLVNHLDHDSRMVRMGKYFVHMNHIRYIYDNFPREVLGLNRCDVDRDDRQNTASVEWLTFPIVRECLLTCIEGRNGYRRDEAFLGTHVFMLIIWYYAEIYQSEVATLEKRIEYAAIVCHFLSIWHNWVKKSNWLTLQRNFLSRETYLDTLISCHFAVSLICYMRDCFPDTECHLKDTGTDCCETFFSTSGQ